jgi:hypothetical protein
MSSALTPAAAMVCAVASAVIRGDWALARWAARQAVASRAVVLWDDGADVELRGVANVPDLIQARRALDADERPQRCRARRAGGS